MAQSILNHIAKIAHISNNIEITAEANSGAIDYEKFGAFKTAGINRISLGVQALNDRDLKFLGRIHDTRAALTAMDNAGKFFNNWSCDLIYARPRQTIQQWLNECQLALQFAPKHISLYQLTIEPGTDFHRQHRLGLIKMPSMGKQAKLFTETRALLAQHNMPDYEISNHALAGYESRHNITYWQSGDWWGVGPGAHSRITHNGRRITGETPRTPAQWLHHCQNGPGIFNKHSILTQTEVLEEYMMMGLRLTRGVPAPQMAGNGILCNGQKYIPTATDINDDKNTDDSINMAKIIGELPEKYAILYKKGLTIGQYPHLQLSQTGHLRLNAIIKFLVG